MVAKFRKFWTALRRRFAGKGESHLHYHYVIQGAESTLTLEQLEREQRREERLRGYGR